MKKNSPSVIKKSKSEDTRQRILDAAARLFRHQGYSVRLADVADAAGVKTGSLYYHFKGRDALVDEVLRLAMETLNDYVKSALASLPKNAKPIDKLKAAIRADVSVAIEVSDYSAANNRIFPLISGGMKKRHYARHKKHGDLIHMLFEESQAAGQLRPDLDLQTVRMLMFGAINWTAEWYRPDRGRSADSVIEHLLEMIFHGIQDESK